MLRKLAVRGVSALVVIVTASVLYAPYLPRLLYEGYPKPVWPVPGTFAGVPGTNTPASALLQYAQQPAGALTPELTAAFTEREGRALLLAQNGRVLLEHYAPGITRETRLNSYSMVTDQAITPAQALLRE